MKAFFVFGAVAAVALSSAQSFVNTFGSGDSYFTGSGSTISGLGSAVGVKFVQGFQFTAGNSGSVSQMVVAMGHVTGTPQVTMRLYSDSGNTLGSQIGSDYTTSINANSFGTGNEIITRDVSAAGWSMTSGQNYWLLAQSPNDAWLAWNDSNSSSGLKVLISNDGAPGYSNGTHMAVRLEAVPEPASMIALGAGLLAVARARRKR